MRLCPLDILDWRKMDTKEDIWEYTKDKYDIPEAGKKCTLETVQAAWRKNKSRLKKVHFDAYENDETQMKNFPEDVPYSQFKEPLRYWNSEKVQENDKGTSNPLIPKEVFVATSKRKAGRSYMCTRMKTQLAEMEDIEAQQTENGNESVEAFAAVMGPEHLGCLRLYVRGVTRTSLRGKLGCSEHSSNSTNCLQKMEEQKATIRQEVVADVLTRL